MGSPNEHALSLSPRYKFVSCNVVSPEKPRLPEVAAKTLAATTIGVRLIEAHSRNSGRCATCAYAPRSN